MNSRSFKNVIFKMLSTNYKQGVSKYNGSDVTSNNSTNNNAAFFFVSDFKI